MIFKLLNHSAYKLCAMVVVLLGIFIFYTDFFQIKTAFEALPIWGSTGIICAMAGIVAPFPVDPVLTAQSVAYKNETLIADLVSPRVPVGKANFKHREYALTDGFTIPDMKVGRTSSPNTVEFGFTEKDSSTEDYGLDDYVPNDDIANAPDGYDPVARANVSLTDLLALGREKRVADKIFASGTYASTNRTTLSGTSQFSDYTNSNPIDAILQALDIMIMRGNTIVMGQSVWTKLRQHPKVVSAILGNAGTSGSVTRQQFAEQLEIKNLFIGSGWYNTAAKGQTASMSRLWGKHLAIMYQDSMASPTDRVSFSYTAQFQNRVAGQIADPKRGLRGAVCIRVGESVKELTPAGDLGYLFINAVA